MTFALQLREAATGVGRLDVAAKPDEAIVLIAGTHGSIDRDEQKPGRDGKGRTVLGILDRLASLSPRKRIRGRAGGMGRPS